MENKKRVLAQKQSGYLERKTPIVSDKNLNMIYITTSLNIVQIYKKLDRKLNHVSKEHYTVTYVIPNFLCFLCFVFHQLTWICG
jgi:hypothetical protein